MRATKVHVVINAICFITIIVSLYFGMNIYNAKDNQHLTHLSTYESASYFTLEDIPVLTAQAVLMATVFIIIAFGVQIYSYFLAEFKLKKQVILGLLIIYSILFFFAFFVMADHHSRNFYDYGLIWVLLSLTLIFANTFLIFWKKA